MGGGSIILKAVTLVENWLFTHLILTRSFIVIFKLAIIEDEQDAMDNILEFLKQYESDKKIEFAYFTYQNAFQFLSDFKMNEFHIVFMDINMPGINGMEAAKEMREKDKDVCLIFVTDLAQYAIKGYEVEAYDFIVKPINFDHLSLKLNRVIPLIEKKSNYETASQKQIYIPKGNNKNGLILIPSNVKYIDVSGHNTIVHLTDEEIKVNMSLNKLEKLLPDCFFRCNHCYIVNLKYVTRITRYECEMATGEKLSVSRPRKKEFREALMKYLGDKV